MELLTKFPPKSVGAIMTDPPLNRREGAQSNLDAAIDWADPLAALMARALRPGGAAVMMGSTQSMISWEVALARHSMLPMADLTVLWNTGAPKGRNFGSLTTHVRWFVKDGARHTFNDQRSVFSNVIVCSKVPVADRHHPAQKPVELINFLISLLTTRDDLIVDPFCGSGSVLVSAAMCGRRWVGCDTDANCVGVSRRRAARHHLEEAELRPIYLWVNNKLYLIREGE